MPKFVWVAETKKGRKLKGELEAGNEKIARSEKRRVGEESKCLWGPPH